MTFEFQEVSRTPEIIGSDAAKFPLQFDFSRPTGILTFPYINKMF